MRDNFDRTVIGDLRKRAGERCSNPACRAATSGPQLDSRKSVTIGVAAHIHAAAQGGPRFHAHMSAKERRGINNAIWLCQNCHKLVDNDAQRYTAEALIQWKDSAEQRALRDIAERPASGHVHENPVDEADGSAREVIELGDNNVFSNDVADLQNLATRCAIHAIDGRRVEFVVRLQPTILKTEPADPLWRPRYEKARQERADILKQCLDILASPEVHRWWSHYLSTVADWQAAMTELMEEASIRPYQPMGHKIDVWRTAKPKLSAPIYLASAELSELIEHLKIQSMRELQFGPDNYCAVDLPREIVVKRLIPRIVLELIGHDLVVDSAVLNLMSWHIGDG
ncbi:hypothetical protein [Dyella subtropica]|uniref:hypothetical protein n=1 Tax=Dyella subtropica TaxID=2992127 RepID=UPI002251F409|nr:hypothetical protein [Dyella subtropica]